MKRVVQKLSEELGPDPNLIAGRFDVWFSRKAKIAQIIDTLVDLGRI